MITATGLVMAVKDDTYTKDGVQIPQVTLAVFSDSDSGDLLPALITYGKDFCTNPTHLQALYQLKGKRVSAALRIMSFKNGGYKLLGTALPKVVAAPAEKAA